MRVAGVYTALRPPGHLISLVGSPRASPSSRGLGRGPFKAETRVRIPVGTPHPVFLHPLRALPVLQLAMSTGEDRATRTSRAKEARCWPHSSRLRERFHIS